MKDNTNIQQVFQWEFKEHEGNFLELAFTYLLKCFYFPKYFRTDFFELNQEEIYQKAIQGKNLDNYSQDQEWKSLDQQFNQVRKVYNNYLYSKKDSSEFIKYMVKFMPIQSSSNEITDEQVEQIYQAWKSIPSEWKEKKPWYPLSYCDLALDDCLIMVKWSDKVEIEEEEIRKLIDYIFAYDFPTAKIDKVGIYFARQGKLLICPLNKCPSDIVPQDFREVGNNSALEQKAEFRKKVIRSDFYDF